MSLFRLLLRKKQSKGHGIHSPFAFDIITNVLHPQYSYYSFTDIPENFPYSKGESKKIKKFNHLSFRLVNHFNATNILEINPGNGLNTLYIKAPSSKINYKAAIGIDIGLNLIEKAEGVSAGNVNNVAKDIEEEQSVKKQNYDAIFINITDDDNSIPSIEMLLEISKENTFWVINPINTKHGKHFCKLIVNHERVSVSFDTNNTLIAFIRRAYYKQHYFV